MENSGRVEIFYGGVWGTVCNISWDIDDAAVVCHQLGYPNAISLLGHGTFTEGEGVVWLEGIDCHGNETRLTECGLSNWGQSQCDHTHDAGVVCESPVSSVLMTSSDFTSMAATSPLMLLPFSPSHDQQATPTATVTTVTRDILSTVVKSNGQSVTNTQKATPTVSSLDGNTFPWVSIVTVAAVFVSLTVAAVPVIATLRFAVVR